MTFPLLEIKFRLRSQAILRSKNVGFRLFNFQFIIFVWTLDLMNRDHKDHSGLTNKKIIFEWDFNCMNGFSINSISKDYYYKRQTRFVFDINKSWCFCHHLKSKLCKNVKKKLIKENLNHYWQFYEMNFYISIRTVIQNAKRNLKSKLYFKLGGIQCILFHWKSKVSFIFCLVIL